MHGKLDLDIHGEGCAPLISYFFTILAKSQGGPQARKYNRVGQSNNELQFSFGRTKCPMPVSPRRTILRMDRTMSVTEFYFHPLDAVILGQKFG